MTLNANRMIKLAADHVDWFSEILKPLLRSWMEHGYKHGWDDALESERVKKLESIQRWEAMGCGDYRQK